MSTLSTLRTYVMEAFGEELIDGAVVSGTLSSMASKTTVADTDRAEADDYWLNAYIYLSTSSGTAAPHGEERQITDYESASTITVSPGFSTSTGDSYDYEIRRKASRRDYDNAINQAIRRGTDAFWEVKTDTTTIVAYADQYEYDLPSDCEYVLTLDLEQADIAASGTATAGASTTLTDSGKSWTTNEWSTVSSSYAVVIYDGTGQGQQRTISSNTSTVLTVSSAWTTNPSTDSDYYIKYIGQEEAKWLPIRRWRMSRNYSSGTPTLTVHFGQQLNEGMSVRIQYLAKPSALSSTTDNTSLPDEYVIESALAVLYEQKANRMGPVDKGAVMELVAMHSMRAEAIKNKLGYRIPPMRLREPLGKSVWPEESALW